MTTIINDLHLGAVRKGGTTPTSQENLRDYMFVRFNELINKCVGDDLVIAGDLFDSFEIAPRDWIMAFTMISHWCASNLDHKLFLMAGNHDHSPKGYKASSFEMLTTVLLQEYDNVVVIDVDECKLIKNDLWAIAHCSNQDMFDMKLEEVKGYLSAGDSLILHANYANNFADQSDHSLNVKNDVAKEFANAGIQLIFAHEHQRKVEIPHGAREGCTPVVILGNQIPSSISDCLGNDTKYFATLADGVLEVHACWDRQDDDGYAELPWRALEGGQRVDAAFIRITGEASSNEAAQVVDAIHKFRLKSSAFVVSNAVKIEGIADIDDLPETFEAAKKFDVMQFIYEQLDADERKVIEAIVEEL